MIRVISIFIAGAIVAFISIPAAAKESCQNNPRVVDSCFEIHGRISIYNGYIGVRIWPAGTNRLLGVLDSEAEIMPDYISQYLGISTKIYGDFLVCPFTKQTPDHMQMICIESGTNLVIERYLAGQDQPEVFKIKNKQ